MSVLRQVAAAVGTAAVAQSAYRICLGKESVVIAPWHAHAAKKETIALLKRGRFLNWMMNTERHWRTRLFFYA